MSDRVVPTAMRAQRSASGSTKSPTLDASAGWTTLGLVNDWTRTADTKAAAILATDGVLGGLAIDQISPHHAFAAVLQGAGLLAIGVSAALAVAALLPRLRIRGERSSSLTYFEAIARDYPKSADAYVRDFTALATDPTALLAETATQIWVNSLVARRKYRAVKWATLLLGVAMFVSALGGVLQRM